MKKASSLLFLTLLFITAISITPIFANGTIPGHECLVDEPVVIQKSKDLIKRTALEYLTSQNDEDVSIWVFFTDKGIFTKEDFNSKAASLTVSERSLNRRSKVNKDKVLFADLPVVQDYIDNIINSGGKLRRISRWLNAASFDIPLANIVQLESLPFVVEVKPLAKFNRRDQAEITDIRIDDIQNMALSPDILNYGLAQDQLEQIHVPPVHNMGYDGSGVTLAVFDTGYRKSHEAFAQHYADGRVLAEWDFIFNDSNTANETEDISTQWNHGTLTWSTAGGLKDGTLYGPAYKANFILCKTEDVRSETPVEEDNWVAALEWVDPLGADVVTSSLTYTDWYTYSDFDGQTATITIAANTAAGLGIIVCNSMGNSGPSAGTLGPPCDGYDIVACAAMDASDNIASFSSRGPTYDGRMKPEVGALGVNTACASSSGDYSYTTASGTSLSTPLVAGAVCLLIQAHPNYTPQMIIQSLKDFGDHAENPDNNYGWGIINTEGSFGWGANFNADITFGDAPQTIQFTNTSSLAADSYVWSFGDGGSSYIENPTHYFGESGVYDVSLNINTEYGIISREKHAFIILLGDTLTFTSDSVFAGEKAYISVNLKNSQPIDKITIPFTYGGSGLIDYDSVTFGNRTSYFDEIKFVHQDSWVRKYTVELSIDVAGTNLPLEPGYGEVMRIHFSTDPYALGGSNDFVDTTNGAYQLSLRSEYMTYNPRFYDGNIVMKPVIRGNADNIGSINVADLVYLVNYLFKGGSAPVTIQSGDANSDLAVLVTDLTYLVEYLFKGGQPPATP